MAQIKAWFGDWVDITEDKSRNFMYNMLDKATAIGEKDFEKLETFFEKHYKGELNIKGLTKSDIITLLKNKQ